MQSVRLNPTGQSSPRKEGRTPAGPSPASVRGEAVSVSRENSRACSVKMKIDEHVCERQGATTRGVDDGDHPGTGGGSPSRDQGPQADHKKPAPKTVKVSLLSDGSPKSVLKNTKNCYAGLVNAVGSRDGDAEIQTPLADIMARRKDEDLNACGARSATDRLDTLDPSSSSSAVQITQEECVKWEHTENGTVTSEPAPVTMATKQEDPGVSVTRDKDQPPHVDQPRDSEVPEEGGQNEDGDDEVDSGNDDDGEDDDDDDDDDADTLVLSDDCGGCVTDGESHYITTHEIQLAELSDQDEDGQGRDVKAEPLDEDSQVYSFVDYASCVDATGVGGGRARPDHGTRHLGSDLLLSPDESRSRDQKCSGSAPKGQVQHLSIKTSSRAINDSSSESQDKQDKNHHHIACTRLGAARGRGYVFRGAGGKIETLRGGAKCFIAAPGRLHFGRALKGRDATGFSSSGASSALSELDDADKEVRHLTGRAFKSLAYPYLGAINFSSSSESSAASDHGLGINRWSAFVDLKYGKLGVDQLVARQNPTSQNMELMNNNNNKGYKGVIKAPGNKLFTLNNNNSSMQKIELLGTFGQAPGGVFTLTETLNFRCNVESGMSGGERRAQFAQSSTGSRSTDEVTDTLPGRQWSATGTSRTPCNAGATMEDTHKKAIFASSLLKNVISKKMQFEEERKMERGEICERQQRASSAGVAQLPESNPRKGRELQRQSSRFSETSSDTIVCLDELGDMVDTGSCDTVSDSPRQQNTATPAPETHLESIKEAGIDPSNPGRTLLRSQNSAFRSWRDGGLEFQTEHKNCKTPEEASFNDHPDVSGPSLDPDHKLKKMSHLFVPTIQIMPNDWEVETQRTTDYSMCASALQGETRDTEALSDKRRDADSRRMKISKSPEIKINLMVKEDKKAPFGAANLRPHDIGGNAPAFTRAEDSRCHALSAVLKGECFDKVPHFMVRDIRDNKAKLQTPIHQVRDVRKLVKSSYHFVSLDNNDTKSYLTPGGVNVDQKKQGSYRNQASVSPIVIKCQSVNTNSNGKQSGNIIDSFKSGVSEEPQGETDRFHTRSPEDAKGGPSIPKQPETLRKGDSFEGYDVDSTPSCRQDKSSDLKGESGADNQSAFRKLQAAVKTMEQLYVFDRNEWRRKREPGHALPVTTASGGAPSAYRDPIRTQDLGNPPRGEERDLPKPFRDPARQDDRLGFKPISVHAPNAACDLKKTPERHSSAAAFRPHPLPQTPGLARTLAPAKSPQLPVSVRISQAAAAKERQDARADLRNYLTIPLRAQTHAGKRVNSVLPSTSQDKTAWGAGPGAPSKGFGPPRASETTAAAKPRSPEPVAAPPTPLPPPPQPLAPALYSPFPLGMLPAQPQVFCFSPAAMSPGPAALDPFMQQTTQRKMLLDPTTGSYYLVDTPVLATPPASRRLFDPETGQYVDFPVPQPPMAPMTPVPMHVPPVAFSPPGAYGHTYMFYPGLMPGGVVPAQRTIISQQPQVMCVAQGEAGAGAGGGESPYFVAVGRSPQQLQGHAPLQGGKQPPVVSISSQQGAPRIVAPPSFDGTTMSFVVEHR